MLDGINSRINTWYGEDESRIIEIETSKIDPNINQPRKNIENSNIEELANSIKKNGIIQPIVIRPLRKGRYEIIAGERRFKACVKLGFTKIPAIIKKVEDLESAKLALIENIQREDLNIVEEALAYEKILNKFEYTQKKLSEEIGKSRSYIANTVRLLDLSEEVLDMLKIGKISTGHGKVLLSVKNLKQQKEIADIIVKDSLTVRQAEKLINKKKKGLNKKKVSKDEYILSLENELMMSLGTKVNLVHGKDKGIIEIEYYGEDDLGRILDLIN